jgi:hypothetical protein
MSSEIEAVPQVEEQPESQLPAQPRPATDNNPYSFESIVGVPSRTARQIRQRAGKFIKEPERFRHYALKAAMQHALIMDWLARNSQEPDKAKVAAESFLKISGALLAKGKK